MQPSYTVKAMSRALNQYAGCRTAALGRTPAKCEGSVDNCRCAHVHSKPRKAHVLLRSRRSNSLFVLPA
eukprot:2183751-Pleurochrysis_carterae.AAC.1